MRCLEKRKNCKAISRKKGKQMGQGEGRKRHLVATEKSKGENV